MFQRLKRLLVGAPRDLDDPHLFHKVSLIAFLAWVGLGADGLSSSAYGPDEAFRALGEHRELAMLLAVATALTVLIISAAYSNIIERFPSGGGGYVVSTKLLGSSVGVVSGCALLVDYVLTITVSIASGADQIFSFLPANLLAYKWPLEFAAIVALTVMNLRGVKESIRVLVPIFLLFLAMHIATFIAVLFQHAGRVPSLIVEDTTKIGATVSTVGALGTFLIFARAYSMGAGTFTGIEAVSNGLQIMREPRVATGKRTMVYMAISLALTAGGILFSYLLLDIAIPRPGEKTLNAAMLESLTGSWGTFGHVFVGITLLSEAALLVIAAQTGFIDGPRVMANMALDSWLPHRFTSLSERLSMHYGIFIISIAAIAALLWTHGQVDTLVTMYSINVFITFSLSTLGMCWLYLSKRREYPDWRRRLSVQGIAFILCLSILCLVVYEKFEAGAWVTLAVTLCVISFCALIRRYYRKVYANLGFLPIEIEIPNPVDGTPVNDHLDHMQPTAVLLVGGYSGLGIHSLLEIRRVFPEYFKQVVFVTVAVVDSGSFKGTAEIDALKKDTQLSLAKYAALARKLGFKASTVMAVGNEPVAPAVEQCCELALRYRKAMFFAGKLVFHQESWYHRFLHNETALAIQHRLQWLGYPMVVLPIRIWGTRRKRTNPNGEAGGEHGAPPPAAPEPLSQPQKRT
ncbi:MAG TPA: APC family permease [Planctomycetota bacterium]|jgi:amino acid transporter